jgi:hypothetical protein
MLVKDFFVTPDVAKKGVEDVDVFLKKSLIVNNLKEKLFKKIFF